MEEGWWTRVAIALHHHQSTFKGGPLDLAGLVPWQSRQHRSGTFYSPQPSTRTQPRPNVRVGQDTGDGDVRMRYAADWQGYT